MLEIKLRYNGYDHEWSWDNLSERALRMKSRQMIIAIIVISFAMAFILPAFSFLYVFPSIERYIVNQAEEDAARLSEHLSGMFSPIADELMAPDAMSGLAEQTLDKAVQDFGLLKLRYFSSHGKIIYSTDRSELGQVNEHDYFRDIVAKGQTYKKFVKKGKPSAEGEKEDVPVVEVYVPVMDGGQFQGAFEFYVNVSKSKARLEDIVHTAQLVITLASLGFLVAMLLVSFRAIRAIDDTQRTQDALALSEEKFSVAFKSSPDWLVIRRASDKRIVDISDAFLNATALERAEVLGKSLDELPLMFDKSVFMELDHHFSKDGVVKNLELNLKFPTGNYAAQLWSAEPVEVGGEPCILSVGRDITALKRAQENEQQLYLELKAIFDNIPVGTAYLDSGWRFINANKSFCALMGTIEKDIVGAPCNSVLSRLRGRDGQMDLCGDIEANAGAAPFETLAYLGNKAMRMRVVRHGSLEGRQWTYLMMVEDVTDQMQAEQEIISSLHEKELLLKEIHHRVKNNLQIISSLLSLQYRDAKDDRLAYLLKESQGRIRSMALIHEGLYQTRNLSRVDFDGYIRRLTTHLLRTYGIDPSIIRLIPEVSGVTLGLDHAIPCGLIINELISNALKYAFPNGAKGDVHISISKDEGQYCLEVRDTGIGLSEEALVSEGATLGLKLVHTLTRQIDGSLSVANSPGAHFVVRFPANDGYKGA